MRNLIDTPSATTDARFHPLAPTSNCVRLIGEVPCAPCWVMVTGTVTFYELPLMVSAPVTTRLKNMRMLRSGSIVVRLAKLTGKRSDAAMRASSLVWREVSSAIDGFTGCRRSPVPMSPY